MKRLPFVLLILSSIFVYAAAQTKPTSKNKNIKVQPTKTPAANKTLLIINTPTPTPIPTKTLTTTATSGSNIKLGKFESEIFAELNLVRANPQAYAKYVEDFLKTFDGKYFRSGDGVMLESFEGNTPVEEVIAVLKITSPLPEFKLSNGMVKAATDHIQDLVKNNMTGHKGSNGSLPDERARPYGTSMASINENISYGTKTARDVVLNMLIDDGYKARSHRKNLLNPQLKSIGLATGDIKQAGLTCVLMLTTSFTDKP